MHVHMYVNYFDRTLVRMFISACMHTLVYISVLYYIHNVTSWNVMSALPVRAFKCSPNHSVNLLPGFQPYDLITFGIKLKYPNR